MTDATLSELSSAAQRHLLSSYDYPRAERRGQIERELEVMRRQRTGPVGQMRLTMAVHRLLRVRSGPMGRTGRPRSGSFIYRLLAPAMRLSAYHRRQGLRQGMATATEADHYPPPVGRP